MQSTSLLSGPQALSSGSREIRFSSKDIQTRRVPRKGQAQLPSKFLVIDVCSQPGLLWRGNLHSLIVMLGSGLCFVSVSSLLAHDTRTARKEDLLAQVPEEPG